MAIRFSMSEDTSLTSSTSTKKQSRTSPQQEHFLTRQFHQNNLEEATSSRNQTIPKFSNIREMQLFYEMKQEFPNIPDDVVSQHVIQNIHDPENCKAKLKSEKDSIHLPVQSYPQQLLQNLNRDSFAKKLAEPTNTVSLPNSQNVKSNKKSQRNGSDLFLLDNEAASSVAGITKPNPSCRWNPQISTPENVPDIRAGGCSIQIKTSSTNHNKTHSALDKKKLNSPLAPRRPTTLRLKKNEEQDLPNETLSKQKLNCDSIFSPSNTLPPTQTAASSSPSTAQKFGKTLNATTTIRSPTIHTNLGHSEILVNVSLSPSSSRSRNGGGQRHQSTINVRPELPFTRNLESASGSGNNKSYTSVNLVLRQPSSNPQSLIDITVGPNITYSSSSYHAGLGYHNNYQITVSDECGVFSAFRISPLTNNSPPLGRDDTRTDDLDENAHGTVERTINYSEQNKAQQILMRQHKQKERIQAVLRKNKNKLSLVHKEVDFAEQTKDIEAISEMLDSEIDKLRCDCQTMLNEIENSRKYGLSEESIQQTNSIKSRQAHSFPRYKALRYPASISTNCLPGQQSNSSSSSPLTNVDHGSQRLSAIAYRDENSNFGAGD